MTRRVIGFFLLFLGAAAVAASVALPAAATSLLVVPLDQQARTTAVGQGVTAFYPGDLREHPGLTVTARRNVAGLPGAQEAGPRTAVWSNAQTLTADDGTLITVTQTTACIDRRTGEAVNPCPSARLNGSPDVQFAGQVFTFPIGTEQRDYEFFDTSARAAFPARYLGTEQLGGREVYRFEQRVPETVVSRREVPAEIAGAPAGVTGSVPATFVYSNTRTLLVEPTTGVIVKGSEDVLQYLRGPGGTRGATVLDGTIVFDDPTVAAQLASADENAVGIRLVTAWGPIVLAVLGLVLIIVGAVLVLRRPRPVPGRHVGGRPLASSGRR